MKQNPELLPLYSFPRFCFLGSRSRKSQNHLRVFVYRLYFFLVPTVVLRRLDSAPEKVSVAPRRLDNATEKGYLLNGVVTCASDSLPALRASRGRGGVRGERGARRAADVPGPQAPDARLEQGRQRVRARR